MKKTSKNFDFKNISLSILTGLIAAGVFSFIFYAFAAYPDTAYTPGQILNPSCAPGDTNCTVLTPAVSGNNTDITGLRGLNTQEAIKISPFGTSAGETGEIRFLELAAGGTNYIGFKSSDSLAANVIWVLPNADGSANQALITNGSGSLSWSSVQAYDADLTTYAGITPSANIQSLLASADYATARTNLGLGAGDSPTFTGLTATGASGLILGTDTTTNIAGYMKLWSAGANNWSTTFTAGTQTADATYTLPTAMATANSQALLGSTAGVLSWGTDFGANAIATTGTVTALGYKISGAATTGTILRADGTNYVATTATYPATTTINQILYSSAANTIGGITAGNSGVLVTGGTGIPSIATDIPTAVTIGSAYIYRASGTDVPLADGGTNASLTASNGGIFYSTASAGAILAGTATANQILMSGASTTPAWSTATYPATTTANQVLYSSATNVIGGSANLTFDGTTLTAGGFTTAGSIGGGAITGTTLAATAAGGLTLGTDTTTNIAGYMKLWSAGANNWSTTFTAGTQTADATYTLPVAMPAADNYALISSTAGVLSWNDQALLTTSSPQFANLGIQIAANTAFGINGTSTSTATTVKGISLSAIGSRDSGFSQANIIGIDFNAYPAPTNPTADRTVLTVIGGQGLGQSYVNPNIAYNTTVTNAYAFRGQIAASEGSGATGVANIGTGYTFQARTATKNAGAITTLYSFYDEGQTAASTNWGFYSVSGNNYFGGKLGIGEAAGTVPTALLKLGAGTATASTAPLKFTSGVALTTAEAGAMEFNTATNDDLWFTITTGAARKNFILGDGTNLTSGRVPYATTNGRLTDAAGFTFDGTTLTAGGFTTAGSIGGGAITGTTLAATAAGGLTLGTDTTTNIAGYIKLWSAGANNWSTTFTAGTQTADATYTLPTAMATANSQALLGSTAGVLSWGTDFGANAIATTGTVSALGYKISGAATTGTILRADGTNYVATTATYPATTTINQILYSSDNSVIGGITTGNSGVLVTGATGIPSIATDIPTAVTIGGQYVYRAGGTDVPLADGGTNASLTASNGGIFYSTASAGAILAGTATANQILLSGASTTPAWSTATYPATATGTGTILRADGTNWVATTATYPTTTTANQVLYSSATNVIGGSANLTFDGTTLTAGGFTTAGSIGGGGITGTSFIIGANTLNTTEWAFLDGQDQSVFTTSSPQFAYMGIGNVSNVNYGINMNFAAPSAAIVAGIYGTVTSTRNSAMTTAVYGLNFGAKWAPTTLTANNSIMSNLIGVFPEVRTTMPEDSTKTMTITNLRVFDPIGVYLDNGTSATKGLLKATNAYIYKNVNPTLSNGAEITTLYGFYDVGMTVGTTNWGFYGVSAQNLLSGKLRLGSTTAPDALLALAAGTATAGTAPLKFTTGTSLTTAEAGAMEFTTDDLFFTITTGAARKGIILNDGTNLTATRVPYATTNGRLTDAAGFTFDGTTLTAGGFTTAGSIGGGAITGTTLAATAAGGLTLGTDTTTNIAGYMKLWSAGANNWSTTFTAGTQTADATYTLPTAMATANSQALLGSTAGVLSWGTDFGANAIATTGTVTALGYKISGAATTGTILRGDGTNYVATTATYPATTTINQILYSSAANTIGGITAGNSGVLVTGGTGIPSIATDIPTAVTIGSAYIYRASGTDVAVADGGTGRSSHTAYALIAGGTTTTAAQQSIANSATTGTILRSAGTSAVATWSTATYPATTTVNQLLYSTSANVIGGNAGLTFDGTTLNLGSGGVGVDYIINFNGETQDAILTWLEDEGTLNLKTNGATYYEYGGYATSGFDVNTKFTTDKSGQAFSAWIESTVTNTNYVAGFFGGYRDSGASAPSISNGIYGGAAGDNYFDGTNTRTIGYSAAGYFINEGGGSLNNLTITQAIGLDVYSLGGVGIVTAPTATGVLIRNPSIGTITTNYGLYIEDMTRGATDYAIYSAGGTTVLVGAYSDTVGATNRDLYVDNTGKIGYVSSSIKTKTNIRELENTSRIYDLHTVIYDKIDGSASNIAGLIAEEVDLVMPELVSYKRNIIWKDKVGKNKNGDTVITKEVDRIEETNEPETVNYSRLIVPMLKEIQELKKRAGTQTADASDERFKENITPLGDGILDKLNNIQGVYYNWNDLYRSVNLSAGTSAKIGMIAQNVEQQFPELITEDINGYKNFDYSKFTAVLLEGVKELNQKIDNISGSIGNGAISGVDTSNLVDDIKNIFANLGLSIENGIATLKEIIVDKFTAKVAKIEKLEMVDKATGEIWCTWIENGEWQKAKGECGTAAPVNPPTPEPPVVEPEPQPAPEVCDSNHLNLCQNEADCATASGYWYNETCNSEQQAVACVPNWQCDGWQPALDIIACGEAFTQTQICADLNNCGANEGKPAEQQEAVGTKDCQPQPEPEPEPEPEPAP